MNVMPTLVRREFQEHRALWAAPLAMAVILVLVAVFGHFEMATMTALSADQARAIMGITVWAMSLAIFLIAGIVLSFYLLDCLYADRRDRFLELLFARCDEAGSALVFVSHDLGLASRFGRTVELRDVNRAAAPVTGDDPEAAR